MFRTQRERSSSFFLLSSPFLILPSIFLCEPKLADQRQIPNVYFFFCFSSPFLLFHSLFPFSPENGNKKFTPLSFPYGLECSGIFSNFSWALVFLMYLLGKLFGDYPWWEYACCWGLPAYKVIHFLDSQISEKKSLKV